MIASKAEMTRSQVVRFNTRRQGLQRVRTGCATCKIRRVKCDETRPICIRCQSTGRRCDGYHLVSRTELSHMIPSRIPGADDNSLRSLEFFQHVVAPVLSGPLGRSFWTHLVAQLAHQEPAARNAVITISSLYEGFGKGSKDPGSPSGDGFAMQHYNRAIKDIISLKALYPEQVDTAIIVSILFSCIECMRGNKQAAVSHSRHGILLMNSSRPNAELASIFRHLSFVTLFSNECLAELPFLTNGGYPSAPSPFQTFAQAQEMIDWLGYHAVKLARLRDTYRSSSPSSSLSLSTTSKYSHFFSREIRRLKIYLETWIVSFTPLKEQADTDPRYKSIARILEMRWLASKIWTNSFIENDETAYDAYTEEFERIIEIAEQSPPPEDPFWSRSPKFMFEMGFAPQLYFTVMKCRYLPLRLKALALMKDKCCKREILWDSGAIYVAGRQIIEKEHHIKLPDDLRLVRKMIENSRPAPLDTHRLCDLSSSDVDDLDDTRKPREPLEIADNRIYFHFPISLAEGSPSSG